MLAYLPDIFGQTDLSKHSRFRLNATYVQGIHSLLIILQFLDMSSGSKIDMPYQNKPFQIY